MYGNIISNVRFDHLNITNGLPQNTVNCIEQDNFGFIWLGTRNGLSRFDGYEMRNYYNIDNDSLSLTNNFIISLHKDKSGRLWILNEEGICRYDRSNDKFKRYNLWTGHNVVRGNLFCETESGRLFVSTFNEVYEYSPDNDKFILLINKSILNSVSFSSIFSLDVDNNDILWLGTQNGIRLYDLTNKEFINNIYTEKLNKTLLNNQINRLFIDQEKRIWIGTSENGVFVFNAKTGTMSQFSTKNGLTNNNIGAFSRDNNNNIWIGTEQGINVIDKNLKIIQKIEQNASDLSNLSDNAIYSIFLDNAKNIWVGTFFGGLNIFYKGSENFTIYPFGFLGKHLSGKAVRQIIANDPQSLWIATEDGGLNFLDRKTGEIKHFQTNKDKISLSYHNVHSLLKDKNNNLWIGTFTGGLNCYNLLNKKMKYYSIVRNSLPAISVFSLVEDNHSVIWAGTPSGLLHYVPEKDMFIRTENSILSHEFIYSLFQDTNGYLWIGTRSNGLFRMDIESKDVKRIQLFGKYENFVTFITEDAKKQIWVGTNNAGVVCINQKGEEKNLTIKNGLPSNSIKGIVEDDNGKIWLSTEAGLCCYSPNNQNVENYTINDGLPINQFNFSSVFKAADGELFFGTIDGLISFNPDALLPTKKTFNIEITDFKIKGKKVETGIKNSPLKKVISVTDKISLSHDQASSFSFEFTGLNYRYASSAIYAIRLLGADHDWQIINKQRQVLFSNLPEGTYTLQIKASVDGINWDESGMRSLDIVIKPPYWKSWWAYIFYFILLATVGYFTMRIIRARIQLRMKLQTEHAEKLQLEELNRHKINFFTFITHDLKTPLTLILSPLQRLINSNKVSEEVKQKLNVISRNANRMNNLIDEIMIFSKIEMKQMKILVKKGDVLSFISEIAGFFEMIALEKDIEFVLDIPTNQKKIVWFSPSNLERIIYNLLSNAFKYTSPNGIISLSANIEYSNNQTFLNINVEDSGRGIPKHLLGKIFDNYYQVEKKDENQGTGIGLALTKVLVNMHKGTIRAVSEPSIGSKFIVHLNVSESAFEYDEKSTEGINNEMIDSNKSYLLDSVKLFSDTIRNPEVKKTKKMKILIIEDNTEMNDYLVEIFSSSFDVVKAFDGNDGFEKVNSNTPDIIISDIMMPIMDGIELSKKLKSNLLFSHIPIVLLTAKTMEADFTEGYSSGADAYIVKPFNSENLELLVNNLLKTRQRNIERFNENEDTDIKEIVSNPRDEKFMSDLVILIMDNIRNEDFGVTEITSEMAVSRSLLHIKLKKLADVSITEFIKQIKMKEARKLLLAGNNVSETSFAIGISDPNYFTKCFKKYTGFTPSEFIKNTKK